MIFLQVRLHVCFNFLKEISQHSESAGLGDLWTESGVDAANNHLNDAGGKGRLISMRSCASHQMANVGNVAI